LRSLELFNNRSAAGELTGELPFLPYHVQAQNSYFIAALHALLGGAAYYPTSGTHLAALRFGSNMGYTQGRYNYVDSTSDWVVWVKKDGADGAERAKFFEKLVDWLGLKDKPDTQAPSGHKWYYRSGGTSCADLDLGVDPAVVWDSKTMEAIWRANLKKDDDIWLAAWLPQKVDWKAPQAFHLYADVCVLEYDEEAGKACLDSEQKHAGFSDWLGTDNCIRPQLLDKLLPPRFAPAGEGIAWDTLHLDGHSVQVPRELMRALPQWNSAGDGDHPGVYDTEEAERSLEAMERKFPSYCLPLDGQITSGAWFNTMREAPLVQSECEGILRGMQEAQSPLAPFCRLEDVKCAEYGPPGKKFREAPPTEGPDAFHPLIPRADHDEDRAVEALRALYEKHTASARRTLSFASLEASAEETPAFFGNHFLSRHRGPAGMTFVPREMLEAADAHARRSLELFNGRWAAGELTGELPFLPYYIQAQNSYFIAALQIILGGIAHYPTSGTHLSALRFGSNIGYTQGRYNFVDSDSDWAVWVKKGERASFFRKLVDWLGLKEKPDTQSPSGRKWYYRSGGTSCANLDLGVDPFGEWGSETTEAIGRANVEMHSDFWLGAWLPYKVKEKQPQKFILYSDVCVFEYDEETGKACLDSEQTHAGLSDWLGTDNCVRPEVLDKLLPPLFAPSAEASAWDTIRLDGHSLQVPRDLMRSVPQWKSVGYGDDPGVYDASETERSLEAVKHWFPSYCLPLDGQITSGGWFWTMRETPLAQPECEGILRGIQDLQSPLAPFCRPEDKQCTAYAPPGRHFREAPPKEGPHAFHPLIPRADHDEHKAVEALKALHEKNAASARRVLSWRALGWWLVA